MTNIFFENLQKQIAKNKIPFSRQNKIGLPPGTPLFLGQDTLQKTTITLANFDSKHFEIKELSIKDIEQNLSLKKDKISWLNITGLHQIDIIQTITDKIGLSSLLLEDILNTNHRPKVEFHNDLLLIIIKKITQSEKKFLFSDIEQISIILKKNLIITFCEKENSIFFKPLTDRIKTANSKIHSLGPVYTCYCFIDLIIDHYFIALETLEQQLDSLEEFASISYDGDRFLSLIQPVKKLYQKLHYNINPLREFISKLQLDETSPFKIEEMRPYLNDLRDHLGQIIETIDNDRDAITNILNLQMTNVSNRMNKIMKFLTILSAIFIPLTFITGIYGMNFKYIPGIEQPLSFYFIISGMSFIAILMGFIFKFYKWF